MVNKINLILTIYHWHYIKNSRSDLLFRGYLCQCWLRKPNSDIYTQTSIHTTLIRLEFSAHQNAVTEEFFTCLGHNDIIKSRSALKFMAKKWQIHGKNSNFDDLATVG